MLSRRQDDATSAAELSTAKVKRRLRSSVAQPDAKRSISDGYALARPSVMVRELLGTHVPSLESGPNTLISRVSTGCLNINSNIAYSLISLSGSENIIPI